MRITYGEYLQEHPLPFIRKSKRGRVESYWDVKPTGDYCRDSATGTEYALNFMATSYQRQLGTELLPIVRDMAKVGDFANGIAFAFLCTIANVSIDGWTPAVIAHARRFAAEENASSERWEAKFAAEWSARARKAALAGAAKRRAAKRRKKRAR